MARAPKELSDVSGSTLIGAASNPAPHYHGHRRRLLERFLKDPGALPDYELLEMILAMAQPRVDTKPVAKALLKAFNNSLAEIVSADADTLRKVDGVGEVSRDHVVERPGRLSYRQGGLLAR